MIVLWIFLGLIALLALLHIFFTAPAKGGKMPAVRYYAHRGLHNGADIPENTLPAFKKAVEAGYGIELDVQLSKDGIPVVFHDHTLLRVCGKEGFVEDYTAAELASLAPLGLTDVGGVPTLKEVLALVDGKVPLIVEIKADAKHYPEIVKKALELLCKYKGEFVIESFHPGVLSLVRKADKRLCRGQLCSYFRFEGHKTPRVLVLARWFLANYLSRPHFIAYDFKDKDTLPFRLMRFLYPNCHFVAWTPASEAHDEICQDFDALIFEHYTPSQAPYGRIKK